MFNSVEYVFLTQPQAYRFLNTASHLEAEQLSVKYGRDNYHVRVRYKIREDGFDDMLARLDDLASEMEGEEVH